MLSFSDKKLGIQMPRIVITHLQKVSCVWQLSKASLFCEDLTCSVFSSFAEQETVISSVKKEFLEIN